MSEIEVQTEEDTERVAQTLSRIILPGDSVGLRGELGAGKTTFVRYLVGAMGGDSSHVASPSYSLQHEYRLPHGIVVEHWDLYRLTEMPQELEEASDAGDRTIRLLEWPDRCPQLLSDLSLIISFHLKADGSRRVSFAGGARAQAACAAFG